MSNTNKTYRIRTEIGTNKNVTVNLEQDYNTFEILSLQLTQEDTYRLQTVDYGVIVGRVLANGGFGVPNAKISVFIESDESAFNDVVLAQIYPYKSTRDTVDGIRYNLLPDKKVDDCHRPVGTFPNKTYLLENDDIIEVFDKYYKYTTRTNNAGDYIICGVPVGTHTIHMDLDLSDCGILSQKPRDFYYKGYNVEQFENPNQFKTSPNIDSLSQIFTQDQVVNVIPFWGNRGQGETIGVTRADIDVNFKFEPTCVFIGSIISDNASKGISRKCLATDDMGAMDELVTGEGTIEMIRKTPENDVEEFQIKGTELINSDGIWCYQIPMNLDYMVTDEYGNMVPTDNPNKGIPTRTRVRFRISMHDTEENTDNYFLSKVLVPNNPQEPTGDEAPDYDFGTKTKEPSYRDLFWNNVYSVKSYIPRIQHSLITKNKRFTGIKHCNTNGNNNPMPYNNIRIKLPLLFTMACALVKTYIRLVYVINTVIYYIAKGLGFLTHAWGNTGNMVIIAERGLRYVVLSDGLCPDIESWYFAPGGNEEVIKVEDIFTTYEANAGSTTGETNLMGRTLCYLTGVENRPTRQYPKPGAGSYYMDYDGYPLSDEDNESEHISDTTSIAETNVDDSNEKICLTSNIDYLMSCVEMNLAQEYRVINFDFYNDWINGTIYLPRWNKYVTKKRTFIFDKWTIPAKIKGCLKSANGGNNSVSFGRTRRYVQQCAIRYKFEGNSIPSIYSEKGCDARSWKLQKCHNAVGFAKFKVFGGNGGVIREWITSRNQYVYYAKPCEWDNNKKVNLFATDIILLGSLNDCNEDGLPQAFKHLSSTTYIMPTNLALTNMDDNGYLYTGNTGTVCAKYDSTSGWSGDPDENSNYEKGLLTVSPQTFANTEAYYADNSDETVQHDASDDYIPLTEASGIAWNYSGPDQGEIVYGQSSSEFYQPGGHFIGMSCFNSQTNIKSCVNLARICEAGTSMSQRREVIREISVTSADNKKTYKYRYFIPTGFISKDCIVDEDFRTMFATMNHNRLIATAINEKTGYRCYDYSYKHPSGFDGSFERKWTGNGTPYNEKKDVSGLTSPDGTRDTSIDYDPEITANTYARTTAAESRDYYFFRMGINDYTNLKDKYLISNSSSDPMALPMYENSFYFYFGLHPGATALDELNKQFFATCVNDDMVDEGNEDNED